MKFSLLTYKKEPLSPEAGKYIGVLVQDGKTMLFDYDKSLSKIKKYDPNVDQFLINALGSTIEKVISEKSVYVSTHHPDASQTTPGDIQFLEDLRRSYQGKVQFSTIREANFPSAEAALKELYKQYVVA